MDPQDFIIPASDAKGHNERVNIKAPPGMLQQVGNIVGAKVWPYRNSSDVWRHSMARHMAWLEQQFPIKSVTAQVMAVAEVMREEEFHQEFEQMFNKLQTQVNTLVGQGREARAKTLVTRVKLLLDDMPESDWKTTYVSEMDKRFGIMVHMEEVTLADLEGN